MGAEHKYSEDIAREVRELSSMGVPLFWIAHSVRLAVHTLTKHYKDDILSGTADGRKEVMTRLFSAMREGDSRVSMYLGDVVCKLTKDPYYIALDNADESVAKRLKKVLRDLQDKKITPEEAATAFDIERIPMPRSVAALLAKAEVVPSDPNAGKFASVDIEEMEATAQKRWGDIEKESTEWLEDRKKDIAALKEEMKESESFKPTE